MKNHNLKLITVVIIASLSILPVYAGKAVTDMIEDKTVTIEQNASKITKVTNIKIIQKDSGITIRVKLN